MPDSRSCHAGPDPASREYRRHWIAGRARNDRQGVCNDRQGVCNGVQGAMRDQSPVGDSPRIALRCIRATRWYYPNTCKAT